MNALAQILERRPPAAPAVEYGGRRLAYGELAAESAALAAGLARLGVVAGDRVALWLPNIPAWLALFFACARIGAIAVSVNTRFRAHEVADIVGRSRAKLLVLWPDFHAIDFAGILAAIDVSALSALEHLVIYSEGDGDSRAPGAWPSVSYAELRAGGGMLAAAGRADDRCVIFTTSGTTRAPKFVCHDQGTVLTHAQDAAHALDMHAAGGLLLQALPLCGVFGFTQAMAALTAGLPMIVLPLFEAELAARLVRERGVTHMNGVDDMIDRMLAASEEPQPFPTLGPFGYALFNPALDDIVQRAGRRGVCVRGLYGMSECHALFALQPHDLPVAERRKGGGLPVAAGAAVRVRDPESGALLSPGREGELEIRGPSLMREYYGDVEATRAAFTEDGFLRTGDLGYLEPDGRFCYVARMGDVLRLGGFLVSPLEIETVLDQHPRVAASQVVAIELGGRLEPVAFILADGGEPPAEAALIAFCRSRLAGYKVPRRVFALDAFPTTASANGTKIQKSRLRALAAERIAQAD